MPRPIQNDSTQLNTLDCISNHHLLQWHHCKTTTSITTTDMAFHLVINTYLRSANGLVVSFTRHSFNKVSNLKSIQKHNAKLEVNVHKHDAKQKLKI